jgi:hypothetical protein
MGGTEVAAISDFGRRLFESNPIVLKVSIGTLSPLAGAFQRREVVFDASVTD